MSRKFSISIISPQNYSHSRAFNEISDSLFYAFRALDYDIVRAQNTVYTDRINIILGGNLLDQTTFNSLPKNSIIYNFEQLSENNGWMRDSYLYGLKNFQVWDYSKKNINCTFCACFIGCNCS